MSVDLANAQALVQLGHWLKARGYAFTTVTPATHARVNRRDHPAVAHDLRDVFGWSRPYLPGVVPPECEALMAQAGIRLPDGEMRRSALRAASLDGQLLFHSSFPTEEKDAVFFGPDTYRFATAIRRLLGRAREVRRVVDIGCGSGAGAILAALACPGAEVIGADINPRALQLSQVNAAIAGTQNVATMPSDLLRDLPGRFDLIIANPPYMLDGEERAYRHGGGELGEGLSLAIVEEALQRLEPGGRLLLYTGVAVRQGRDHFAGWVRQRLQHEPVSWHYEELDPDVFGEEIGSARYANVDRISVVTLEMLRLAV